MYLDELFWELRIFSSISPTHTWNRRIFLRINELMYTFNFVTQFYYVSIVLYNSKYIYFKIRFFSFDIKVK